MFRFCFQPSKHSPTHILTMNNIVIKITKFFYIKGEPTPYDEEREHSDEES